MRFALVVLALYAGCDFAFRVDYHPPLDAPIVPMFDAPPPPLPCPAMAIFCDGFESGDISKWPAPDLALGTAMVDTLDVHSGVYALDGVVPRSTMNGGAAGVSYYLPLQSTGSLAVRLWVSFATQMVNYDAIVFLSNTMTGNEYVEVAGDENAHWDVVDTASVTHALTDHATTRLTPIDRTWQCVELDYTFQTGLTDPTIELFIDDQTAISSGASDFAAAFDTVSVGVTRADLAGFATFTDDVVIATQHIGCQ